MNATARSAGEALCLLLSLGACAQQDLLDGPDVTGVVATSSGVAWAQREPSRAFVLRRWDRNTRETTTIARGFDSVAQGVGHGDTVYWGFKGQQLEVVMSRPDLESVKTVDLQGVQAMSLLGAGPDYIIVSASHDSYWRIPIGQEEATCLVPTIVPRRVSSATAWNDEVFLFHDHQIVRIARDSSQTELELSLESTPFPESGLTTRAAGGWLLWSLPTSSIAGHQLGTTDPTTWSEPDTEAGLGCHACPKISAFTADQTHAYWIRSSMPCKCGDTFPDLSRYWVRRARLEGGLAETLVAGKGIPPEFDLEVDDANVYWVDSDGLHYEPK